MTTFAVLLLCVQACLVQSVYSQCLGTLGWENLLTEPACGWRTGFAAPAALGLDAGLIGAAAYGGTGIGDVAVAGEMGVAGTTLVAGQVPILGAVEFEGIVPAAGAVTITGRCGCVCQGAYL